MTVIVVLAAGASRRMGGRDKLMEEVDGTPLLRRQCARAVQTGCAVFVTLPPAPHARYGAVADLDITAVPVADADEGMNASLRAGLAALPDTARAAMIMLADMPDVTVQDLQTLLAAVDPDSDTRVWRAATQDGAAGHPLILHADLFAQMRALTGDSGGREVVQAYAAHTQHIALPDRHARTDLDTPADWAAWRAR